MLDLNIYKTDLYEIKWFDGTLATLNPPTQKMYNKLTSFNTKAADIKMIDNLFSITKDILENNNEGKAVNEKDLSIELCIAIVKDYFDFYNRKVSEVDFR